MKHRRNRFARRSGLELASQRTAWSCMMVGRREDQRNRDLFAWSHGDRACPASKRAANAMLVSRSTAVERRYPASTPASSSNSQGREEGCREEKTDEIWRLNWAWTGLDAGNGGGGTVQFLPKIRRGVGWRKVEDREVGGNGGSEGGWLRWRRIKGGRWRKIEETGRLIRAFSHAPPAVNPHGDGPGVLPEITPGCSVCGLRSSLCWAVELQLASLPY